MPAPDYSTRAGGARRPAATISLTWHARRFYVDAWDGCGAVAALFRLQNGGAMKRSGTWLGAAAGGQRACADGDPRTRETDQG